jgi:ParB/RepB/Spo0J family partition protein
MYNDITLIQSEPPEEYMRQVSRQVEFDDILADDQARRVSASIESIDALKNSIATIGLLDPIIVEALPGGKYRLCAGRNRYTAIKALRNEGKTQFDEVTCTVLEFDDHELLDENYKNYKISQVIFDSNDKRSQLTKFEQARHYAAQKHQFPHLFKNDEELAKFNNKPANEVVEALRLLAIDQKVVDRVEELNLQQPNTIPFMCLEEIAEAAAQSKRPLPPEGQMHIIELLISPELPDKRALVARDKMHTLVSNVRREFAPDPRGRKPKVEPEMPNADQPTEGDLFNDGATQEAASDGQKTHVNNGHSDGSHYGGAPGTDHSEASGQQQEAQESNTRQPTATAPQTANPSAGASQERGSGEATDTPASEPARLSSSPTLAIVNISITNAINALSKDRAVVTQDEHKAIVGRLEELRLLLDGAVLQAS